jgi:hypothetical protein
MVGTKDLIHELIEQIKSQGWNFVIGIIKPGNDRVSDQIEIFTSSNEDGLGKLLMVLKEHQKTLKRKDIKKNVETNSTDI